MTRTLFFLLAFAAMLMAMTAILIRIELAYPGVSDLFTAPDGTPNGHKFNDTAVLHTLMAYLAAALIGTFLSSVARTKGALWGGLCLWLGLISSLLIALAIVLSLLPPITLDGTALPASVGWTLYPPETGPTDGNLLASLLALPQLAQLLPFYADFTRAFVVPTGLALFVGIYAIVSTEPGFGGLSIAGVLLTALFSVAASFSVFETDPYFVANIYLFLLLPVLACAAIRLVDSPSAGLIVLTLGMIATGAEHLTLFPISISAFSEGTQMEVAQGYLFPLGLAWFALPAAMIYHQGNRLPGWAPWAMAATIILGLALWVVPLILLGLDGQPIRYVDYPETFAARNLAASTGVGVFAVIYLAIITLIRRNRLRT